MKRVLTAATAAALIVLTGCGTEHPADEVRTGSSRPSGGPSTPPPAEDGAKAARSKHDRLFQEVAARCENSTPSPPAERPADDGPLDPEASKYAENHAFKRTMPLKADAECRGRAHSERITAALGELEGVDGPSASGLRTALERLGYPSDSTQVHGTGDALGFTLFLPSGPCLTGELEPATAIETHGPYMEGGCMEPRGGH